MTKLNLKDEKNKQLIKLISDEDIETIEEELEFKIFKLAKSLNQNKITKPSVSSSNQAPKLVAQDMTTSQASMAKKSIKLKVFNGYGRLNNRIYYTYEVNTTDSVEKLLGMVTKSRIVSIKQSI